MVTQILVASDDPALDGMLAEATNHYSIVCDGSARIDALTMQRAADGTETHIITVKGIK